MLSVPYFGMVMRYEFALVVISVAYPALSTCGTTHITVTWPPKQHYERSDTRSRTLTLGEALKGGPALRCPGFPVQ